MEKKQYMVVKSNVPYNNKLTQMFKPIMLTDEEASRMRKQFTYMNAIEPHSNKIELICVDELNTFKMDPISSCIIKFSIFGNEELVSFINKDQLDLSYTDIEIISLSEFMANIQDYNIDRKNIHGDTILLTTANLNTDSYFYFREHIYSLFLLNIPIDIDLSVADFKKKMIKLVIANFKYVFESRFQNDIDKITNNNWDHCVFYRKEV